MDSSAAPKLPWMKNATIPSVPYSYGPPNPPYIHIPMLQRRGKDGQQHPLDMMPSYDQVDPSQLTSQDVAIITRNAIQVATDRAASWAYEQRREAQPILDFLYLGPTSVIRDHAFLQRESITMLLVVRDARMANISLLSVERASAALGSAVQYLDVESLHQPIKSFAEAIRLINDHLLAVYHSQAQGRSEAGQILMETAEFRRGKVLVACETGNDRSAAVVAAYIMAVFGKDLVTTLQFINVQRFCCGFDEDSKRALLTWQDIVRARSAVAMDSRSQEAGPARCRPTTAKVEAKRTLDAMMDMLGDEDASAENAAVDSERFAGRDGFVPFVDLN